MKEALFYEKTGDLVRCTLCPRFCKIKPDESGFCQARKNIKGKLYSMVYEKPSALNVDPIEKKPLYHFMPGTKTFSIGTTGCNLDCMNCQNSDLSRSAPSGKEMSCTAIVRQAKESGCDSVAYTYNEPTVFYEMMLDTAKLAKERGLKNIMVTNGYINPEPLAKLSEHIDAFNVDLKFMDEKYESVCQGSLEPVKKTLIALKDKNLEITNLIIPGLNDSFEQIEKMAIWIKENLGDDVPLHLSRFFPQHRMADLSPTSEEIVIQAREIAMKHLKFVYTGNMLDPKGANTYCPKCKKLLIGRSGYGILINKIRDGACVCKTKIRGL